ncbi:hypothetical protein FACS189499_00910 [Clostridia bacterium]|nr:hypothetical protein FACS189499_00910 [Clostridia bacterium]
MTNAVGLGYLKILFGDLSSALEEYERETNNLLDAEMENPSEAENIDDIELIVDNRGDVITALDTIRTEIVTVMDKLPESDAALVRKMLEGSISEEGLSADAVEIKHRIDDISAGQLRMREKEAEIEKKLKAFREDLRMKLAVVKKDRDMADFMKSSGGSYNLTGRNYDAKK